MSTNPQVTNRRGELIDAPELTLTEVERAIAHLKRQPFRDALGLALRNPTDAVAVVGAAWYADERFRDAIDLLITLRVKNATVLSDALHKWAHELPPDVDEPVSVECAGCGLVFVPERHDDNACPRCQARPWHRADLDPDAGEFCTACQQHKPCSCDDAGDR